MQSTTRCKPTISSLLLSTFSNKYTKNGGPTLMGFSCTAHQEVSVPGVIRSSADWDDDKIAQKAKNRSKARKKKKKKKRTNQEKFNGGGGGVVMMDESIVQDLWCGVDSAANASVDCVRPRSSRNKIDLHKLRQGSYSYRQRVAAEHFGGGDLDSGIDASHIGGDVFEARYYHHLRNQSPQRLAEVMMLQNGLVMSRRTGGSDRYRDWRLDADSMTYEELLELGERIGHVNTGLAEDQIGRCLRKTKLFVVDELSSRSCVSQVEPKCSICQEEYEADEEMGKLECGHAYHLQCIKEWLSRKNACPVCKAQASCQ